MATPTRYSPHKSTQGSRFALSRSEVLGTLITMALLLSLLVPIFGAMEQKTKISTCQDNLRQFAGAVLLYGADYDHDMPFSISGHDQIGPEVASTREVGEFNLPLEVLPYVRNSGIFGCPDDHGFAVSGYVNLPGEGTVPYPIPPGAKVREAYGTSYRIIRQSFSEFEAQNPDGPFYDAVCPVNPALPGCRGLGDALIYPHHPGAPVPPPTPLSLAFFARPADTTLLADDWAWTSAAPEVGPAPMHPSGANLAFADGHVKFVSSAKERDAYCSGPTFSPARLTAGGQDRGPAFGDGSCNIGGAERQAN